MDRDVDAEVRARVFAWLAEQRARHGDVLDGKLLKQGLDFEGQRLPLLVQQGIHKPKILDCALTLRTSYGSSYADRFESEDVLIYSYKGEDPQSWDNVSVRKAMEQRKPLVYLHGVATNPPRYAVVWPVFVVGDDPTAHEFRVQADLDDAMLGMRTGAPTGADEAVDNIRRKYGTSIVKTRLFQARFRERVLSAYGQQCSMCRLRHRELLDAAHITPDHDPRGEPLVTNGLSLCKLHHAAFDASFVAIDPAAYAIHIRPDLLREEDGPMLRHGLQGLEGTKLHIPRRVADRPDPERLRPHWQAFQEAV